MSFSYHRSGRSTRIGRSSGKNSKSDRWREEVTENARYVMWTILKRVTPFYPRTQSLNGALNDNTTKPQVHLPPGLRFLSCPPTQQIPQPTSLPTLITPDHHKPTMAGYCASARTMFLQKPFPGITVPTGPPDNLLIIIPNLKNEEWRSGRDVLLCLLRHEGFRSYLQERVNQLPATLYSPAFLTHPLLQPGNVFIPLNYGEMDETFRDTLTRYLRFVRS